MAKVRKSFRVPVRFEGAWREFLLKRHLRFRDRPLSEVVRTIAEQAIRDVAYLPPASPPAPAPLACPHGCVSKISKSGCKGRQRYQCSLCKGTFFPDSQKRPWGKTGEAHQFLLEEETVAALVEWGAARGFHTFSAAVMAAIEWWLAKGETLPPVLAPKTRKQYSIPQGYSSLWNRFKARYRAKPGGVSGGIREVLRSLISTNPTIPPSFTPDGQPTPSGKEIDFYLEGQILDAALQWGERQPRTLNSEGEVIMAAIEWWLCHRSSHKTGHRQGVVQH